MNVSFVVTFMPKWYERKRASPSASIDTCVRLISDNVALCDDDELLSSVCAANDCERSNVGSRRRKKARPAKSTPSTAVAMTRPTV